MLYDLNKLSLNTCQIKVIAEVRLIDSNTSTYNVIEEKLYNFFETTHIPVEDGIISSNLLVNSSIYELVEEISLNVMSVDRFLPNQLYRLRKDQLKIIAYQAYNEEATEADDLNMQGAYKEWQLPNKAFCSMWEGLFFEEGLKNNLLQFAESALLFSKKCINMNAINFGRTILFYGPPGTGKTSICKAFSQKLSVLHRQLYHNTFLIEVNAHTLFSKWFSESGKLVAALFEHIRDTAEDGNCLVIVLLDEVESLASARHAASSNLEPADAIRAVNSLLTALDTLHKYSNVLILATSNLYDAIDEAFLSRADARFFLGQPNAQARYEILKGAIEELQRVSIVNNMDTAFPPYNLNFDEKHNQSEILKLKNLANICEGQSGRFLKKLPFLAHVLTCTTSNLREKIPINLFLNNLVLTLETNKLNK